MKRVLTIIFLIFILVPINTLVWAGSVDVPNVFSPDTPARADSVNENFSAIEVSVDDNAAMITSLQNSHSGTRTGYYSFDAIDFRPEDNTMAYFAYPGSLTCVSSDDFYAPVNLPHGAVVKSITWYYRDLSNSSEISLAVIQQTQNGSTSNNLTIMASSGNSGNGSMSAITIDYSTIDNVTYRYSMRVDMQTECSGKVFKGGNIEYEYYLN